MLLYRHKSNSELSVPHCWDTLPVYCAFSIFWKNTLPPLFSDEAVYFCTLRFCAMTSPELFHLPVDGFQTDVLLCLCVRLSVLSFQRKQRKGCSERYTPAFPATSQVHLKMSPRARGTPLASPLPSSILSLVFFQHSYWGWHALKGENNFSTVEQQVSHPLM